MALLPIDAETARSLVLDPPLTDAEFESLCAGNDWFCLERTREGTILIKPPSGAFTSEANGEIIGQLHSWWKGHRRGMVFDASGGFYLPDSSMLNPDAAYVQPDKLKGLTKSDLTGFPRLCPDFVVELLSVSDSHSKAQQKMERWIENGVSVGWMIDPYEKKVYVYQAGAETAVVTGNAIQGSGPVEGFALDLEELWRCYEI